MIDDRRRIIQGLLTREEIEGERRLNRYSLWLTPALLTLLLINGLIPGVEWTFANIYGLALFFFYSHFVRWRLSRNRYSPWEKYLTMAVYITIVTLVVAGYAGKSGWVHAVRTVSIQFYFLIIVLSGIYQNDQVPFFTGMIAAIQYTALFLVARYLQGAPMAPMETFRTEAISWDLPAVTAPLMLLTAVIVSMQSRRMKTLLSKSQRLTVDYDRALTTFGQYVSDPIRDRILAGDGDMDGQERDLTVMFADIRVFTNLSESLPARDVVKILNLFFESLSRVVREHGGVINKYIGDGVLVLFGAPVKRTDHIRAAFQAALELKQSLVGVNTIIGESFGIQIRIGLSIHTGSAILGNVGSLERREYTVIGPVVNIASRIEGLNKRMGAWLMFTEPVYTAAQELASEALREDCSVRGLKEVITVHYLQEDPIEEI